MKTSRKHFLGILSLVLTLFICFSFGATVFATGETPASEEGEVGKHESGMLIKDKEPVWDYAYSFAVIGDTQTITAHNPDKLSCIYDWIVQNAEEKKIKYVFGLGDITYFSTTKEWAVAKKEIKKLDGVVPNMHIRGNHDTPETFIGAFPYGDYADKISGSYNKTMLYTYHKFNIGKIKYLALNIDTYPGDDILAWAAGVIEDHPDHNVIIVTHAYLSGNGSFYKVSSDGNDGEDIWEKLVKNHENITMVLAGHIPSDKIVVNKREGVHGNTVTEMLVDPQVTDQKYGPGGYVAMLYFSEDGKNVQVEYISTVHDAYFLEENQFSFDVNVIEGKGNITLYIIGAALVLVIVIVLVFRKKIFRKRENNI
ncbi:MAG: metallophosphoesterase [Clostridia bacterium]|nr:metallophosphoesterase [Clostridia bacterium]